MICHIERLEDGSRRVTAVTEVQRMESDVITLQDIFEFKIESFARTARSTVGSSRQGSARCSCTSSRSAGSTSRRGSSRTVPPANVADLRR